MHASMTTSAEIKSEIRQHVRKIWRVAIFAIVGILTFGILMRAVHNHAVASKGAGSATTVIR